MATHEAVAGRDAQHPELQRAELVIITGLSGSGKGTVLKAFEDLGYYAVDNLPIGLIPKFAELTREAANVRRAALVIDIREGETLKKFPAIFKKLRSRIAATLLFLEADDRTIVRRFSETRRPHPLGVDASVLKSIRNEREQLAPIRAVADHIINTSRFNVHELREVIGDKFQGGREEAKIRIDITSFGYRHGVPQDSDLVFDVRFLPNPNYIPAFQESHRPASQRRALHPLVPAEHRIYRPDFGAPDLLDPALHPGRQKLSDHRLRLHGRPSSVGDDRERDPQTAGESGVQGEGNAPRRRPVAHALKPPSSSTFLSGTIRY